MRSVTANFLHELNELEFFSSIGSGVAYSDRIVPIDEWESAIAIFCSDASEDARLEFRNELTINLHALDKARFQLWNKITLEIKPLTETLVKHRLASPYVLTRIDPSLHERCVAAWRWEILALCMAKEYGDVFRSTYYQTIEECYFSGHFPCGWVGTIADDMEGGFELGKIAVI
jgi:hypothetical protein